MTYLGYELSRHVQDDDDNVLHGASFSVSHDDAVTCAHMLAAGFNTMSRNMMGDFVLAVVDTKAGTANYDGKIEKFDRSDKRRAELEHLPRWKLFADISDALRTYNITNDDLPEAVHELGRRTEFELHARTAMEQQRTRENEAARAELIALVKRFYQPKAKQSRYNHEFDVRLQGMLDVLAEFLVVTGEADADEGHAVARRLCGITDDEA